MAAKVKVTFDFAMTDAGQIAFFARGEVTAAQGKAALDLLMAALQTSEIQLGNISEVEKHRDDPKIQAVHDLTHQRDHSH